MTTVYGFIATPKSSKDIFLVLHRGKFEVTCLFLGEVKLEK